MQKNKSFWLDSFKISSFDKLKNNIKVDVCIVGGGITGITTAYYLSKQGYKVVLLEKDTLFSKTSGHTTAKITSQHGLFYNYLAKSQGENFAKQYLEANETAIKNIKNIIDLEDIECDFENKNAFVFSEDMADIQKINEEVETVNKLGIVECEFADKLDININVKGAIKFKNQAQFNPIKYANGLIEIMLKNNCQIFEQTAFKEYEENNDGFNILTSTKKHIKCKHLVLATRYPVVNFPGYYFLKMYQEISYVIAIKPKNKFKFDGMYISSASPKISIKTAKYNDEDIILVGGYGHKTGKDNDLKHKYENLREKAFEIFGDYDFLYEWNTEDCISLDKIAYIGEFSKLTNNIFVATGFDKWGMTTSNIAANIIVDKINGKINKYEEIYKATRLEPVKNSEELKNMIKQSVQSLVIDKLKTPKEVIDNVNNDEGKIVMFGNEKIGIYKDKAGNVYAVKPVCTHLGCELSWNDLNKTWDCPCHGSRFDYTGKSLYSPSIENLEVYNFE